jgi:hemoglobin-like flavoprotein
MTTEPMVEGAAGDRIQASREAMQRAKESYERCCAGGRFLHQFYLNFLKNCPEAEPMFANADFDRQTRLLQHAIGLLLIYPAQPPGEPNLLERVAERHSRRDLDVAPRLYAPFVDSLIETARQHDPQFTPEVETAWRATLAAGVAFMKSKH